MAKSIALFSIQPATCSLRRGADNIVRLWRVNEGNFLQPPEKLEGHPAETSILSLALQLCRDDARLWR